MLGNASWENPPRRIRWGRVSLLFLILIFFVSVMITAAVLVCKIYFGLPPEKAVSLSNSESLDKQINVLLLGLDDKGSSDAMLVLSINTENNTLNLLSIPPDTKVNLGKNGHDKIKFAYSNGGAQLAVKSTEQLLHISVKHYVAVDLQAFVKVIDVLNGIELYVENNMSYTDVFQNLEINLKKGFQHLDGNKTVQYVRFRDDELGDIGRIQRQQRVLKTLMSDSLRIGTVLKLPKFFQVIDQNVVTDMNMVTILKIVNTVIRIKSETLHAEILPGNSFIIDSVDYWIVDEARTKVLLENIL